MKLIKFKFRKFNFDESSKLMNSTHISLCDEKEERE